MSVQQVGAQIGDAQASQHGGPSVRWEPPDAGPWSLETAHGSELAAVTMQDIMTETFPAGTRRGLAPFGLPLSHAEMHFINGWPYFSFFVHDVPRSGGKPPPAFVLKAITRLHPGFRRRTKPARKALAERRAQKNAQAWFDERDQWITRAVEVQSVDVRVVDMSELADHIERVGVLLTDGAERHFELIFSCAPLGRWFVCAAEWGLPAEQARSSVMHSTPVHEEARARLRNVAEAVGDNVVTSLDELRALGEDAALALDEYLQFHGSWSLADSVRSVTLAERPEAILQAIELARRDAASPTSPQEGLEELRNRVPAESRSEFDLIAADAHQAYKMLDDNSGILAAWPAGLMSLSLREAARRLCDANKIADQDHVWALPLAGVSRLLRSQDEILDGELSVDAIATRHRDWAMQAELAPPRFLGAEPDDPPDPGVFPAPVAELMGSVMAFIGDKFNEEQSILGLGETPVQARALVAENAADALDRIEPGDILVTVATTPAYNTVLAIAGGVVVTEGGPSSHAAVVARELGIPAILGYGAALDDIPDGAHIELDPKHAKVTVLSTD